ncbi:SLATT domain-containing protein [Nocardiopsis sp. N85]|uniref:SLATT domain-containing protein n=1 Tax=Nocardiopsis sp. N85 TaxID=3029400 RepID=UPI00237F248C|nr:SLATT domain-containing protein [Nocardiopsis sp. N85]MDE3721793.1 SLATT domain-containing protein [Nocardiopsis sp. N85]
MTDSADDQTTSESPKSANEVQTSGENEKLLLLNHEVREAEFALNFAQRRRKWSNLSLFFGPLLGLALYIMLWVPWISSEIKGVIMLPAAPTAIAFCVYSYRLKRDPGGPLNYQGEKDHGGKDETDRDEPRSRSSRRLSEGEIELVISQIKDARKLLLANAGVSISVRRITYKEDAYSEIDQFRTESRKFRNVHNLLQGIVIIGSLGATGMAGLVVQIPEIRWAILFVTFLVGVASGFMGYFKYKERSFYLQQTADAVESEWEAVEIGVGRYKHIKEEEDQLAEFVAEVHRLKSEQKKRQQNLEQPPETRSGND